jgi:GntR family transcriptional regulator/MocR family aminotransferase
MDVHIRLTRRGDLSMQIYRQLLEAVLDGRLRAGERLPPTRELARRLDVSRNTVGVAYERLVADGAVVGRVGAGSYVSDEPLRRSQSRRAPTGAVHPREVWREIPGPASAAALRSPHAATAASSVPAASYDFGIGTPDPGLFPFTTWRRLVAHEYRGPAAQYMRYGDAGGYMPLRAAIARHTGVSRAVRADAADVIVTQGAQQAFDLIGRVLIAEGTPIAMEDPGYPYARWLFHSLGAHVIGVPVDDEGLDVDAIPAAARIVYVTPSHQFPLGTAMSLQRRTALLAWAERRGGVIIEDDYDSEFRFSGRPLDPLQTLDRTGRVIYVGSFSKVLLPALRVGFLIAPASLQPALLTARQLCGWHGDIATQAALARFIDQGLLARHIRKVSRQYAERHARITEAIERRFNRWLRVIPSAAGLHLSAEVADGARVDIRDVVRRAAERGIAIGSLSNFYIDATAAHAKSGLMLGYGAIPTARLDEGLKRLATCFPQH